MTGGHRALSVAATRRLTVDPYPWLSCNDCFERLDHYVEDVLADIAGAEAGLRAHLLGCGACCEEARGLITLVAADRQVPADRALRLLDSDLARPRPC